MKYILSFFTLFASLSGLLWAQDKQPDKPAAVSHDFSVELTNDYRHFFNAGAYPDQKQRFYSFAIEPEYQASWKEGRQSLNFTGFFRWETHDTRRTHGDIRELYWQMVQDKWEVSVGAKKVFWGVTESAHLVDIINQTDAVESFDGEAKLGQPMVHFSRPGVWGTLDIFYLPYFRERKFPGAEGRLRPPVLLEDEMVTFESNAKHWHPDFAVRWSHYVGAVDIGLSHFYGTGREPIFILSGGGTDFQLIYPINHQTGLELQAITGPAIWKWESIFRHNSYQEVWAFAAGVEYTFSNVANTGLDIGLLAEYLYDNRKEQALNGLDNDLFAGGRIALNDAQSTQLLAGIIVDMNKSTRLFSVEGSRRLGQTWKVEMEARIFSEVSPREFTALFQDDSFGQLRIIKFF